MSLLVSCLLVRPAATPASAELVYFTSGRTMSVASHRVEGSQIVLYLHNGGEVVCQATLIARIEPDESLRVPPPMQPATPRLPAKPYAHIVASVSERYGVKMALIHAVIEVESAYRADAVSPKGAMGLMQLMPETAQQYGLRDPFDPLANIETGTRHLKSLLEKFGLRVGLAAYNAGEGQVLKFQGIPPFRETQAYVRRILKLTDSFHD